MSNSSNEESDSPTLPPTPGDNGDAHTTSLSNSPPNNASSVSTTLTSTPASLRTDIQITPTNPNVNPSYTVASPPYFQVTSPVITPPSNSNSFQPSSPQSLNRSRQSLTSSNHRNSMQA